MSGREPVRGDVEGEELVLTELVSRVLDRGVVVSGEVVISVGGVDLVELGLHLHLVSTETRQRRISATKSQDATDAANVTLRTDTTDADATDTMDATDPPDGPDAAGAPDATDTPDATGHE